MALSLSYFTYDLICCLIIEADLAGTIHHCLTMAGLAIGVLKGVVRGHLGLGLRATHLG